MLDIPVRAVFIKPEVLDAAACLLENMGIAIFNFASSMLMIGNFKIFSHKQGLIMV